VTIRLLAGPDVGYPAIKQGRFGRSNGKCRIQHFRDGLLKAGFVD
jgi:hypothetical protein